VPGLSKAKRRRATLENMIAATHELAIEIGGLPILVRTESTEFARMLEGRYGTFVAPDARNPAFELDIELVEPGFAARDSRREKGEGPGLQTPDYDQDLSVRREAGRWVLERGDFHAELDPEFHRGWLRQAAQPYAIDGVLRILHSLILARQGGFLVHAASAVRNGRAYLFAGVSGAGKTTISRLAPPDVTLLTDEISYVKEVQSSEFGVRSPESGSLAPNPQSAAFQAFGTPFAGELARIGTKVRAPLATLFLLEQGRENRVEPVSEAQAARELLRHVLFFAHDPELVGMVFQTVCNFARRVPVYGLVFTKDASVWKLIK